MKTFKMNNGLLTCGVSCLLLFGAAATFTACKENISEDAYAIKTKNTIEDYLRMKPELSSIKSIFDEVKLGISEDASIVSSALAARGNYTVFAPNNDAVAAYVSEITKGATTDYNALPDDKKSALALNCIIDNGSNAAYELADFPSNGMFANTSLKDRRVSSKQNEAGDYILNDVAKVVESNLEASNGMLHVVDHVIVPSDKSIYDLMSEASNMRIMSKLFSMTGYSSEDGDVFNLVDQTTREEEYEKAYLSHAGENQSLSGVSNNFAYQTKRYVGYTAFVEPDEVLNSDWGIPMPEYNEDTKEISNWDAILAALKTKCQAIYGSEDADDYKSDNNALRKFVKYHVLDGKLVLEDRSAVHHWNEYKYTCGESFAVKSSEHYTVDVWDYFTTNSQALLKITHSKDDGNFYLNRVAEYNTTWNGSNQGDYSFKRVKYPNNGNNGLDIKASKKNTIGETTYENDGANGYYFPINHVLVNSNETADALSSERMRIDFTTFFPELISNDIRGNKAAYFPKGYFSGITNESTDTKIFYLQEGFCGKGFGWKDYQGDEFIATGQYDLTVRLPRVPKSGQYELRMASSNNSLRGMVQVYIGTSPDRMEIPTGLPIDMRETVDMIPGTPWIADKDAANYDEMSCRENDRNLRNNGYMKGPQYFHKDGKNKEGDPVRNIKGTPEDAAALRRILIAQHFDANKTYYLRFKSAIPDFANSQLFLDYIEFVPVSVYNGATPEDIW